MNVKDKTAVDWRSELTPFFPEELQRIVNNLTKRDAESVSEIRVRVNQRVQVLSHKRALLCGVWIPTADDLARLCETLLGRSMYARSEELRGGYVTLPGGSRAGLCGRAVMENGRLHHLQDISSIDIRIARPIAGSSDAIMGYVLPHDKPVSTLVIGAPGSGKTTVLRDVARQLAVRGYQVGVVDERSEIAACAKGAPQLDIGPSTDVLDACAKAEGMMLLLRVFSPDVLIADEIGRQEDADAIEEASRCGVAVIATAHAASLEELMRRPIMNQLLRQRSFDSYVLLGERGAFVRAWNGTFGIVSQEGGDTARRSDLRRDTPAESPEQGVRVYVSERLPSGETGARRDVTDLCT